MIAAFTGRFNQWTRTIIVGVAGATFPIPFEDTRRFASGRIAAAAAGSTGLVRRRNQPTRLAWSGGRTLRFRDDLALPVAGRPCLMLSIGTIA